MKRMKQIFSWKNKKFLNFFCYFLTALAVSWIFFYGVRGPEFSFDIPLNYSNSGDELSFLAIAKIAAQKQWIPFTDLFSPYLGAPGTLDMGDFPISDYTHLILGFTVRAVIIFTQASLLVLYVSVVFF